jgi:diguanylate cyclase (GGDEF)-like protein
MTEKAQAPLGVEEITSELRSAQFDPGLGVQGAVGHPELVETLYVLLYDKGLGAEQIDAELGTLSLTHGDTVYSVMIHLFSHLRFAPTEALGHWHNILAHRLDLQERLGEKVDLRVALTSYFVQVNRQLQNPKIIELKLFEQTQASAYRDELTGLHNYRLFREYLTQEITRSEQHGTPLSIVMIDVDNFKLYNDLNGHETGNDALALVARLLKRSLRKGDLAARYGGEEFVLILPMTSKTVAHQVAETARLNIENYSFHNDAQQPMGSLTVSMGVATFPADAHDPSGLVRQADRAMYVAKSSGKNQVQLYGQSRRSFQRVAAALKGEYRVLVAEAHPLLTVDVSEKGLRFYADRPLPVGALIDFRVNLAPSERTVNACGRVVHVSEQSDGRYQAALRVTDMEPADHEALMAYLRGGGADV